MTDRADGEICGILADGGPVRIRHAGSTIAAVVPDATPLPAATARQLILPGLVNAHDHARPLALSSFGAAFLPLETWLPRSMLATPPDAYLAAVAPLARAALGGCAAVMVHYTRPSGLLALPDEAAEVARAARDVGVRIAFALAVRDRNPLVYGIHDEMLAALPIADRDEIARLFVTPPLEPRAYLDTVDAIAALTGSAMVDVQYGPAAPQWCSTPLLEAIARASADTGRRVHMHLLETRYQRVWADREFPSGIVSHLRDIGLLSPRLTLAHCAWARPDELDMIAASGAVIVTNPSSNLHIKSGLAPIREAALRGCQVAVGMDGLAFDEDDDMVREMRLAHALHSGFGFDETWTRPAFLAGIIAAGRKATNAPGNGTLAVGAAADLVTLDLDALDRDTLMAIDPLDLMFARGTARHIRDVVVAGRTIVADGRLTGVDLDAIHTELRARYRTNLPKFAGLLDAWPQFAPAVRTWMTERCGCC